MIQRSLQPDVTGEKWRILDDDPCVGFSGVASYMQRAHAKLSNLGFVNMNPTPYVNDLSWITNNPSGQVIGYSSFGNNAGSRDNLPPLCVPGLPRMPEDYLLNTLNFQYANGAIFHTWESYNGWTFSHYRLDDVGGRVPQGLIEDFVHRGGTGGEFHTYEPRVNGMGHDDVHHPAYAMGYTLVDAIYQGIQYLAWQSGVVGDPLVAIAHGKQTMTQSQIWSGANLITGKVTVPAGKTLAVTAGATLKFMPNAELFVEGQLLVNGTASQPVTFDAFKPGTLWKGINIASGAGTDLQYANINDAITGVRVHHSIGARVANCNITGGNYGIFLHSENSSGAPSPTVIESNTINQSSVAAIYVDVGASLPIIRYNTLQGNMSPLVGNYGMVFIGSSSINVVGNRASAYGNAGIYCYNASPVFVFEGEGGHNCSFGNYGAGAIVEVKGYPVFSDMDNRQPGINTLANNQNFQMIILQDSKVYFHENFYRDPDPIPSLDFSVDASSLLFYEPYQSSDPNGCGSGASTIVVSGGTEKDSGDPPVTSLRDPLLQQAVKHRLRGEHAAAMALLKNLVASAQPTAEMKVFAIHEALSNYQRMAIPPAENRLSAYLRNLRSSQGNAEVRRAIADALAHSFRHEANPIGAVAALEDNIRSHPNTSSVLAARYGKVSLAVTELNDLHLARTALAAMRALSPNARITKLASKLVESAEAPNAVSTSMSRSISEVKAMESLPKKFALEQNYPNPFNPTTTIRFAIPQNEHVTLKVYDLLGRKVAALVNEARSAGSYDETFDASKLASGMYIYKLQAGNFTASRKFVLLK